jgi:hypothetical protein
MRIVAGAFIYFFCYCSLCSGNAGSNQKIVIASEARDLLPATTGEKQIPRCARNDNPLLRAGLAELVPNRPPTTNH